MRRGYKQTEVGVFPTEWEIEPLGEHATFRTGPFGSALHKSDYTNDGVPVVNPMHIVDGKIEPTRTMTITEHAAKKLSDFRMKPGEIVIGRRGDMGRCAVVQEHQSGWLCGTGSMIIRPLNAGADFLQRVLSSPRAISAIEDSSVGTTMVNLNQGTLAGLRIQFPPLPEQRAIAAALSDVDALLGGVDRLIAKKRDLKQAAMQQLLTGQTRLPGFHGEWEVKRLGEVAEIVSGGTPRTNEPSYWNGGIKWCTPTDITRYSGKYLTETERTVSRDGLNNSGAVLLPVGALLLCSRATIGELKISGTPICTNQGFKSLVCRPQVSNEFLYYKLLTMKQQMVERAFGSTFLEISTRNVSALEVVTPPHDEQVAIAAVLSDMDAELSAIEARRDKTRALKQGMMQELLTGRTRLVLPASKVVSVDFRAASKPPTTSRDGSRPHNWQINEAVVVAVLVKHFGSERYPLGRKRCTKLAYLMHRHVEHVAQGYLKKAAGPYNPALKYKGPEGIAQKNGYIRAHANGKFSGFVAAEKIARAEGYFEKWYGRDVLAWLEQFRHQSNDQLELLATVDMAVEDMKRVNAEVSVAAVRSVIRDYPEWEAKLEREIFSDANIARAIRRVSELFLTE